MEVKTIDSFIAEYCFLSNFFHCDILFEGKTYPSSEHAFQAAKTLNDVEREKIRLTNTPAIAKRLGRSNKITLRSDWESVKNDVMLEIVRIKFNTHKDLAQRLLDTGDIKLVEGNYWHDNCWGTCVCKKCGNVGKNRLGIILMKVREGLR